MIEEGIVYCLEKHALAGHKKQRIKAKLRGLVKRESGESLEKVCAALSKGVNFAVAADRSVVDFARASYQLRHGTVDSASRSRFIVDELTIYLSQTSLPWPASGECKAKVTNPDWGDFGQDRPVPKVTLLGLPVDSVGMRFPDDLRSAISHRSPYLVTFVNPNSCYIDQHDRAFVGLLQRFDRVLCDGIGMVMAARFRLGMRIPRQAFDTTSVATPVLEWAASKGTGVILVGGTAGVAARAGSVLIEHVPGLRILATFTGFADDPVKARAFILNHPSSLVVCGMGAPLQEHYLMSLKDAGWVGLGFTCGGFLDQVCERYKYYPAWVDQLNLRFLYRLFREPRRLGKRYLLDYGVFLKRFVFGVSKR